MVTLSIIEAWDDFYDWVKRTPGAWDNLDYKYRDQISKAQKSREGRSAYSLESKRIKSILTRCAPGRYEFTETVTLKE